MGTDSWFPKETKRREAESGSSDFLSLRKSTAVFRMGVPGINVFLERQIYMFLAQPLLTDD